MATIKYAKKKLSSGLVQNGNDTYGQLITGPTMSLQEVADEIAHMTGMQPRACANVLSALPEVIYHFARGGLGVQLGFAIIKPSIKTVAAPDGEAVKVERVRLTSRLSTEMKRYLEQISVSVLTTSDDDDDDDTIIDEDSSDSSSSDTEETGGDSGDGSSSSSSDDSGSTGGDDTGGGALEP